MLLSIKIVQYKQIHIQFVTTINIRSIDWVHKCSLTHRNNKIEQIQNIY